MAENPCDAAWKNDGGQYSELRGGNKKNQGAIHGSLHSLGFSRWLVTVRIRFRR
jgi:hypothetical protein